MLERGHRDRSKQKVQNFEIGMRSKPANMESQVKYANVQNIEQLFKVQEPSIVEDHIQVTPSLNV